MTNTTATEDLVVGLLGHTTTSSNLGIGALTVANMRIVEEAAAQVGRKVQFESAAWREPLDDYIVQDNLAYYPLNKSYLASPSGLRALAKRSDVVIDICGGDSFTDIYRKKRLMYLLAAQGVSLSSGTPFVLAPQTIGPFDQTWSKVAGTAIMKRSRLVVARDQESTAFARELMPSADNLLEATDVAFHLPYDVQPKYDDGMVHVGLNVSGLLFAGGYSGKNDFGLQMDYPTMIRELIAHFIGLENCKVHLIVHVKGRHQAGETSAEGDLDACKKLGEEFPEVIVEPEPGHPSEAKSMISRMDFVAGARMHACIAAISSGVPVVPMAYSRKFRGLFGTLGYDHVADCRTLDGDAVKAAVIAGFENRAQLGADAKAAGELAVGRLETYRSALVDLFKTL
ncbi:MAG: polysaccharide pyruvyl transferase family protein [Pseudomonadota bacterium]